MNRHTLQRLLTTAAALATFGWGAGAAAAQPPAATNPPTGSGVAWGRTVHGLQAGIRLLSREQPVRLGQTARFGLVVRNVSDHEIGLTYYPAQERFGWTVTSRRDVVTITPGPPSKELRGLPLGPAMLVRIGPGEEIAAPGTEPQFAVVGAGSPPTREQIAAAPGRTLWVEAQPLDPVAKGEEWLSQLRTGRAAVAVARTDHVRAASLPPARGHAGLVAWGEAVNGLQSGIGLAGSVSRLRYGDTATFDVYVRNVSGSDLTLTWLANGDPIEPIAKGPDGQVVPLSRSMTTSWPLTQTLTLKPREARVIGSPRILIARRFTTPMYPVAVLVARPGTYRIQVPRVSNYAGSPSLAGFSADDLGGLPTGDLPIVVTGD